MYIVYGVWIRELYTQRAEDAKKYVPYTANGKHNSNVLTIYCWKSLFLFVCICEYVCVRGGREGK